MAASVFLCRVSDSLLPAQSAGGIKLLKIISEKRAAGGANRSALGRNADLPWVASNSDTTEKKGRIMRPSNRLAVVSVLALCVLVGCGRRPGEESEPFEVMEQTIAQLQEAITSGRVTCRQIVQAYLDRIEAYDRPSGLNAITVVNPRALERADEIDEALRQSKTLGPLFCAPLIIKDNFNTHDLPTTGGSVVLKENYPPRDAFMVRKLRQADAIVLAKSNMAEWAFSPRQTVSSSYGTTANAYALDRVPAGSSGGTASAVAASFGVAGMGSDTGNSIRGPSSHLALFGIRSTLGLTSREGVIPLAFDRDIAGPMARTVEDAARLFNVVAGYDPNDPFTEDGKGRREADYTVFLDPDGLRGARLGVLGELVDTPDADPEIQELFEQALVDLKKLGAEIVSPLVIEHLQEHLEGTGMFCSRFRYDVDRYFESLGDKAPVGDVQEFYRAGQYSPYIKRNLERTLRKPWGVAPENWDPPCLPGLSNPGRKAFLEDVLAAMEKYRLDAILYPTWTTPPAHLDKAREEYKGDNSQLVAPATGQPAVTVPMGFSHGLLPAGLQMLGRPYGEGKLIQFAYAYEQATRHRVPPPLFPPLN
ncbi:MAG: amidase [Acidobacteriota bacterium]